MGAEEKQSLETGNMDTDLSNESLDQESSTPSQKPPKAKKKVEVIVESEETETPKQVIAPDRIERMLEKSVCGSIVNTHNHPVEISYGSTTIVLAPRGNSTRKNKDLIGALPKGVTFVREN